MKHHNFRNSCVQWLAILMGLLAWGSLARSQSAQPGKKVLPGHVPPIASRLTPVNRLSSTTQLQLAIGLPLRNRETLTNLLHDLYDPSSPRYHQYLTPDEFTQNFSPTAEDYKAVTAFARLHGFTVTATHADRMLLDVSGTVAQVEQAFGVNMRVYQHPKEARTFFAPDTEPSVPTNVPILNVIGLNNYVLPKPKFHREQTTRSSAKVGSGPNGM